MRQNYPHQNRNSLIFINIEGSAVNRKNGTRNAFISINTALMYFIF